jgi:hypothetical protein
MIARSQKTTRPVRRGWRIPIALAISIPLLAACATRNEPSHALWMKLVRWMSADTSVTPVKTTMMGPHMQISVRDERAVGDDAQAEAVLAGARAAMARYSDVKAAERDGYKVFTSTGRVGEEIHFTNVWRASGEKGGIAPDRPGSLLYRRTAAGLKIVGVMYTAKADALPGELNRRVPLSIGIWHRHVHFCGWPDDAQRSDFEGPAPRFGYFGSIADEATCKAARGYWIPVAFGWMTHIYPEGKTLDERWFGRQMLAAEAGLPPGYNCAGAAPEEALD